MFSSLFNKKIKREHNIFGLYLNNVSDQYLNIFWVSIILLIGQYIL